jgi:SPP1 family predicted phage head-tail adaptor
MYVNPGELNKKIQIIQTVSAGTNKNGFSLPPEEKVIRQCFARVSNTRGSEIVKANSEFSEAKKRFLVRYTDTEINTDMVVRYNGKDHDIKYINPYGDGKEYMEIWTELSERV